MNGGDFKAGQEGAGFDKAFLFIDDVVAVLAEDVSLELSVVVEVEDEVGGLEAAFGGESVEVVEEIGEVHVEAAGAFAAVLGGRAVVELEGGKAHEVGEADFCGVLTGEVGNDHARLLAEDFDGGLSGIEEGVDEGMEGVEGGDVAVVEAVGAFDEGVGSGLGGDGPEGASR